LIDILAQRNGRHALLKILSSGVSKFLRKSFAMEIPRDLWKALLESPEHMIFRDWQMPKMDGYMRHARSEEASKAQVK
jgi:CheY-like chemotaxis protein